MSIDRTVISALAAVFVFVASSADVWSQTNQANQNARRSTPNKPASGIFGNDWARPYPQTGGNIYMDPRTQNTGPAVPSTRRAACPSGHSFNSFTGICQ